MMLLLVLLPLAGCVQETPVSVDDEPAPLVVWDGPLAQQFPPPATAMADDRAERRAHVRAPGHPAYAWADAAMDAFMDTHDVGAGALAVMVDGHLRYTQGYGHLDRNETKPTPPDAMFRIASVTKPMTAALLRMLIDDGHLSWDDPVFCMQPDPKPDCLLDIPVHPARPIADARVADLTLEHLRDHRTGWDRSTCSPDYDGQAIAIANELGIPSPPSPWRFIQWLLGEPMSFAPGGDPGDVDPYCNLGYRMMVLAAQAATGASHEALYEGALFAPLDIGGDIEPARTLPEDRNPREPYYACDFDPASNVYDPNETVCQADGGFSTEGFIGSGHLIATAEAAATAFAAYGNDGSNWRDRTEDGRWMHGGGQPGVVAWAERFIEDGVHVEVVILLNARLVPEYVPDEPLLVPFLATLSDSLRDYVVQERNVPV